MQKKGKFSKLPVSVDKVLFTVANGSCHLWAVLGSLWRTFPSSLLSVLSSRVVCENYATQFICQAVHAFITALCNSMCAVVWE